MTCLPTLSLPPSRVCSSVRQKPNGGSLAAVCAGLSHSNQPCSSQGSYANDLVLLDRPPSTLHVTAVNRLWKGTLTQERSPLRPFSRSQPEEASVCLLVIRIGTYS
ncbi:hypothetical protein LX32DRAFT_238148 [Colletotrichum zoysiae]|uniref:Uncharacterized protein n=1 Tax=Colletotrichum zoysiae TaxID=1216348 RepID=A0AAD9M4W8_9PEZI|nr:hypothetical protein LX32DRAFT_238148 [Colletotrichum zoysiae]